MGSGSKIVKYLSSTLFLLICIHSFKNSLMYLSKSDFKVASNCPSKLYFKKKRFPSLMNDNPYLQFLADGGYMVEKIATRIHEIN